MKISTLLLVLFLCTNFLANTQNLRLQQWREHFDYTNINAIYQRQNGDYYCVSTQGIMIVGSNGNTSKLSKINGLSDIRITATAYNKQLDAIVIGYNNGNIDIIGNSGIKNITDYLTKNLPLNKSINNITVSGNFAFIASGIGIIKLNIELGEIVETYIIGDNSNFVEIEDIAIVRDTIFAVSNNTIFKASLKDNLIQNASWQKIILSDIKAIHEIAKYKDRLVYVATTNANITKLFYNFPNGKTIAVASYIPTHSKCYELNNILYISGWTSFEKFDENGYNLGAFTDIEGLNNQEANYIGLDNSSKYVVGTRIKGAILFINNNYSNFLINGTYINQSKTVAASKGIVVSALGGFQGNTNLWYTGTLSIFRNNQWYSYRQAGSYNFEVVAIDPINNLHFYVGSGGSGAYEYIDTVLQNRYFWENSPIETLIDNGPYSRVLGVAIDNQQNVWFLNSAKNNLLNVLTKDKTWLSFNFNRQLSEKRTGQLIVTKDNIVIGVVRTNGLIFLDYKGTLENKTDDKERIYYPIDQDGERIGSTVNCLAEDKDGTIWIGTDQGIGVIYKPEEFSNSNFSVNRIKVTALLNDAYETGYLLGSENILSIAVDGGNRKWIGTENSGVYLVSPNGTNQILNFTTKNSPLPSNSVQSIAIEPNTGEVFFATAMGLVSYRSEATEAGTEFGNVYVFPNPVRPNYSGLITITNLAANVDVKITDIAGNLVYQTTAIGGQAVWDGKNFAGNRVASGIYLVFCTNEDGSATFVTKILFLN